MRKGACEGSDIVTCIKYLKIRYKKNGKITKVRVKPGTVFVNGDEITGFPYDKNNVVVKIVTGLMWLVYNDDFEVLFDRNGRVYVRLSSDYSDKVSICSPSLFGAFLLYSDNYFELNAIH